jgi:hypothetical protein
VTEPLPQPQPPQTVTEPVDLTPELERRNMIFGLALFGLVILIFGATVLVAYVYLALD